MALRDFLGFLLVAGAKQNSHISPLMIECLATRLGILTARDHGFNNILRRRIIILDCAMLLKHLNVAHVLHVKGTANIVAYGLSHFGLSHNDIFSCINSIPNWLSQLLFMM